MFRTIIFLGIALFVGYGFAINYYLKRGETTDLLAEELPKPGDTISVHVGDTELYAETYTENGKEGIRICMKHSVLGYPAESRIAEVLLSPDSTADCRMRIEHNNITNYTLVPVTYNSTPQ